MKIIALSLFIVACVAEPPVDNRYLPPSQVYGTPGAPGLQRQTDAVFRRQPTRTAVAARRPSTQYGAPSSRYGAPSVAPSNQYIPPQNAPSTQYGAPSQAPRSQYGAPRQSGPSNQYIPPRNSPSTQYGAPSQAPSSQYGAPSSNSQFGAPNSQYLPPSSQYGVPNQDATSFGAPNAPSQQYGAPGFGGGALSGGFGGPLNQASRQYLPPGAGRGSYDGDEGNNEPANYSFEYMVKDDESGNDFGHRESRQGDRAEGLYYVLLPDGRKQTVEYEADQDGYKPRISYEDTGRSLGGYDRNSQGGYQNGYENQGPY